MKKLYLAFIAVLALTMGCAITSYPVITDTEEDAMGFVVNTNGKAIVIPTSQTITIFPTYNVEFMTMIDQNFAGDQTIPTVTNISHGGYPYKFLGYTYCNPDYKGCAIITADNPNYPNDPFDYTYNINCKGIYALSLLVSYFGRLSECGRDLYTPELMNALTGSLVKTTNGYRLIAGSHNTTITAVAGDGAQWDLQVPTTLIEHYDVGNVLHLNAGVQGLSLALGQIDATEFEVCFEGVCTTVFAKYRDNQLYNQF
jgi:hypothetical protein